MVTQKSLKSTTFILELKQSTSSKQHCYFRELQFTCMTDIHVMPQLITKYEIIMLDIVSTKEEWQIYVVHCLPQLQSTILTKSLRDQITTGDTLFWSVKSISNLLNPPPPQNNVAVVGLFWMKSGEGVPRFLSRIEAFEKQYYTGSS